MPIDRWAQLSRGWRAALVAALLLAVGALAWSIWPALPTAASGIPGLAMTEQEYMGAVVEADAALAVSDAISENPVPANEVMGQVAAAVSSESCIACHTNRALLQQLAEEPDAVHSEMASGEGSAGELPPLEVWEAVLVNTAFVEEDVHGKPGCIACHGGTSGTVNKAEAHQGLLAKASAQPEQACGTCHVGVVAEARDSLHRMQWGYQEILSERGADFTMPETVIAYQTHCTTCHADCGDCHVSRPSALGGGLLAGHTVKRVASVFLTCGGCHSARVNDEYKGVHEGIPGDVHWEKLGMPCTTCHDMEQFHQGTHGTRYDGAPDPSCTDAGCHEDVRPGDGIVQHALHNQKVSCQVCHAAGAYKSCFNCHTARDDQGIPYFTTDESELTFKIGRNPEQSASRPWDYVLLRHAPANPDLFAYYGDNLLPEFDQVPTWKYATPHNMRRLTPQNESCNNCHGQEDLFLTEVDVAAAELEANRNVIVTEIPASRAEVPR